MYLISRTVFTKIKVSEYNQCRYSYHFFYIEPEIVVCKAKGQESLMLEDCIFPFRRNGIEYNGCAPGEKGEGPICATEVDSAKDNELKKWGRCNKYCEQDKGKYESF